MLVVHCAAVGGSLAIWGETNEQSSADQLCEEIAKSGVTLEGEHRTLTAWLPTADGRPSPSSPLIGEVTKHTTIKPWPIEAIIIEPAAAIELLVAAVGKRLIAP